MNHDANGFFLLPLLFELSATVLKVSIFAPSGASARIHKSFKSDWKHHFLTDFDQQNINFYGFRV